MGLMEYDIETLIVRKLSGQISPEEDAWLMQRVETDENTRAALHSSRELWESAARLRGQGNLSQEQRFAKLQKRIEHENSHTHRFQWLKYAAAVIVVILVGGYWLFKPSPPLQLSGVAGKTATFILPDSSSVIVNGTSSLTYYPESFLSDRQIVLEGEAYFNVKHSGAPFVVTTHQAAVTVLGTSFNIESTNHQTRVACLTGKVKVNHRDQEDVNTQLTQGLGVQVGSVLSDVYEINESDIISWTRGELHFQESKLRDVFAMLSKRFNKSIQYQGELPDVAFSGKFIKPSLNDVLETICLSAGLTYEIGADSVIIIKK